MKFYAVGIQFRLVFEGIIFFCCFLQLLNAGSVSATSV